MIQRLMYSQNDFSIDPKRSKKMQKTFFDKDGTNQNVLRSMVFELFEENGKKLIFCFFFRGFYVVQRLMYSQNDFSIVPKRPKEMQKTFSRKMGPTRTFYDRRFSSYSQKTKGMSFFSVTIAVAVSLFQFFLRGHIKFSSDNRHR